MDRAPAVKSDSSVGGLGIGRAQTTISSWAQLGTRLGTGCLFSTPYSHTVAAAKAIGLSFLSIWYLTKSWECYSLPPWCIVKKVITVPVMSERRALQNPIRLTYLMANLMHVQNPVASFEVDSILLRFLPSFRESHSIVGAAPAAFNRRDVGTRARWTRRSGCGGSPRLVGRIGPAQRVYWKHERGRRGWDSCWSRQ
jgi:hypothetical protein